MMIEHKHPASGQLRVYLHWSTYDPLKAALSLSLSLSLSPHLSRGSLSISVWRWCMLLQPKVINAHPTSPSPPAHLLKRLCVYAWHQLLSTTNILPPKFWSASEFQLSNAIRNCEQVRKQKRLPWFDNNMQFLFFSEHAKVLTFMPRATTSDKYDILFSCFDKQIARLLSQFSTR